MRSVDDSVFTRINGKHRFLTFLIQQVITEPQTCKSFSPFCSRTSEMASISLTVFVVFTLIMDTIFGAQNILIIKVISFSDDLHRNWGLNLIRLLAINDAFAGLLAAIDCIFMILIQTYGIRIPAMVCSVFGGIFMAFAQGGTTLGQFLIGISRIMAIFTWNSYRTWFTQRSTTIMFVAFVWLPSFVISLFPLTGLSGQYDWMQGYGHCLPRVDPADGGWSTVFLVTLTILPYLGIVVCYTTILIKLHVLGRQAAKRQQTQLAGTPTNTVVGQADGAAIARQKKRARGSLMMFIRFVVYVATSLAAPIVFSKGGSGVNGMWSVENDGLLPMWALFITSIGVGLNFVIYVAFNKEFRRDTIRLFQHWFPTLPQKIPKVFAPVGSTAEPQQRSSATMPGGDQQVTPQATPKVTERENNHVNFSIEKFDVELVALPKVGE